jgi:very-short-patch-repair endonuclease
MDALSFAKQLRQNQTDAENLMWRELRASRLQGFKFKRQVPLDKYFADFVCFEAKLIIELDGGQHNENAHDVIRDKALREMGFTVLRFWNNDVLQNLEGVKLAIVEALSIASPHPSPLTLGERE